MTFLNGSGPEPAAEVTYVSGDGFTIQATITVAGGGKRGNASVGCSRHEPGCFNRHAPRRIHGDPMTVRAHTRHNRRHTMKKTADAELTQSRITQSDPTASWRLARRNRNRKETLVSKLNSCGNDVGPRARAGRAGTADRRLDRGLGE